MKKLKYIMLAIISIGFFACNDCEEIIMQPCGGSSTNPKVDLIVLIDQSGSMSGVANQISLVAQAAIDSAKAKCPTDLRVEFMGVDGNNFSGTLFTTNHRTYLQGLHGAGVSLAADAPYVGYATEQGANAVEDLSNLFDWRPDACRAIFYISDEELDGSTPRGDFGNEDLATANAIATAQANSVAVFSHFIDIYTLGVNILTNYSDLSTQTGGINFTTNSVTIPMGLYDDYFEDVICNSCNGCQLSGLANQ